MPADFNDDASGSFDKSPTYKCDGNIRDADAERTGGPLSAGSVPDAMHDEERKDKFTCHDIVLIGSLLMIFSAAEASYSLLAPFFPQEAAKRGVSKTVVGFIFATYEFTFIIFTPIFGHLVDRLSLKSLYIAGSIFAASCSILFGLLDMAPAGPTFITLCFLLRTAMAVGDAALFTAGLTVLGARFQTRIGTVIAGGYRLPFFVLGALMMVFAIPPMFLFPVETSASDEDTSFSRWRLLARPSVAISLLASIFSAICVTFIGPILAKFLKKFHLETAVMGLFFVIPPFVYAVTAPVTGIILDKWKCGRIFTVAGTLIMVVGYLLLGPSPVFHIKPTLWLVGLSFCLLGVGASGAFVPVYSLMLAHAREIGYTDSKATHGVIATLTNTSFFLGACIGPLVAGALTEAVGFGWSTSVVALVGLILTMIFIITYAVLKSKPRPQAEIEIPIIADDKNGGLDESSHIISGRKPSTYSSPDLTRIP